MEKSKNYHSIKALICSMRQSNTARIMYIEKSGNTFLLFPKVALKKTPGCFLITFKSPCCVFKDQRILVPISDSHSFQLKNLQLYVEINNNSDGYHLLKGSTATSSFNLHNSSAKMALSSFTKERYNVHCTLLIYMHACMT